MPQMCRESFKKLRRENMKCDGNRDTAATENDRKMKVLP